MITRQSINILQLGRRAEVAQLQRAGGRAGRAAASEGRGGATRSTHYIIDVQRRENLHKFPENLETSFRLIWRKPSTSFFIAIASNFCSTRILHLLPSVKQERSSFF